MRDTTPLNLNGVRMTAASTDEKGVVTSDTVLEFAQSGNLISARYRGGPILKGYLIGHLRGVHVRFRYVQADNVGNLDSGVSAGVFARLPDGRLQLTEHFHWETRSSEGTNIFVQLMT